MNTIQVCTRYIGVSALAAELGVSKGYLSRVLHGLRKSARIEAELAARGIKITHRKKARE